MFWSDTCVFKFKWGLNSGTLMYCLPAYLGIKNDVLELKHAKGHS